MIAAGAQTELASYAQSRLWFLDRLHPGLVAYNLVSAFRVRGPLDAAALAESLRLLAQRHESLRTSFAYEDGAVVQRIAAGASLALEIEELAEDEPLRESERIARLGAEPFDLATAPLARARLVRAGTSGALLLIALHHIVTDGWSSEILLRELSELYAAARAGGGSLPGAPPPPYRRYAREQRAAFEDRRRTEPDRFWTEYLRGAPLASALPLDRPRPRARSFAGARVQVPVSAELRAGVRDLVRRERGSLFLVFLAAFGLLFERWTGERDVLIGVPFSGRGEAYDATVGFFSNALPVRVRVEPERSFADVLDDLRGEAIDVFEHQETPLERVVDLQNAERAPGENPLFQTLLSVLHERPSPLRLAGAQVEALEYDTRTSMFDLVLNVIERGGDWNAYLLYDTDLFAPETMERAAAHLVRVLEQAVANPRRRSGDVDVLTPPERAQLAAWNATERRYDAAGTPARAVARAAAGRPADLALQAGSIRMTYGELERRAEALERALAASGIGTNPVAVATGRNPSLAVGALAAWKLGLTYVPLDLSVPLERLRFILADSGARALIVDSAHGEPVPEGLAGRRIDLASVADAPADGAPLEPPAHDLPAYCIYTSGSTGVPKGVLGTHRGAWNLFDGFQARYPVTAADRCACWASAGFDLSLFELFTALCFGAAAVFAPDAVRADPAAYARWLRDEAITVAFVPPFALAALREPGGVRSLRRVYTGLEPVGEALLGQIADANPGLQVVNLYGPTECSMWATAHDVEPPFAERRTPIGRPLPNVRAHVLDAHGRPAPVGVTGELLLAGDGVGAGYLDGALTAQRFVPEPFGAPGSRAYRTGDRCRRLPGGELVFAGRTDRQLKLRGLRIEPGEIEAALRREPGVRDAAVVLRGAESPALHAYVTAGRPAADELGGTLLAAMRATLPASMVPATITVLDRLPVTANGKLDERALPEPGAAARAPAGDEPASALESEIARIWCGALGVARVGRHDNFFALGGNSLSAVQAVNALRDSLRTELPLLRIFESPTVAELAASLEGDVR